MPDEKHGRPTSAHTEADEDFHTCGVYCVADGLGNPFVTKGSGTEWLKVVWPSSCIGGGGARPRRRRPTRFGGPSRRRPAARRCSKDPRLEPRALVWLRNRHPEHAKGQAPVFGPSWRARRPTRRCVLRRPYFYLCVELRGDRGVGRRPRRWRRGDQASYRAIDVDTDAAPPPRHRRDTVARHRRDVRSQGRTPEELKLMQFNAEELKAARAKRSRLQKWIIYRKKEAIRRSNRT